jgi:integral membrane sensor domain MASE1
MSIPSIWLRRLAAHRVGGPALTFVGTVAGYVALARGSQQLVDAESGLASFCAQTGLVVALLVLVPARLRPWVLAAVIPGELLAGPMQRDPALTALGWAAADIVEAILAAWILMTIARRRPLGDTQRDFLTLALAAFSAPLAGGFLGAGVPWVWYGAPYGETWLKWWFGDATGILLVVPLVFSFARPCASRTRLGWLAGLTEVGLVVGAAVAVFGFTTLPVEFLVLAPLVLLAVRHGLRLTAIASLSFSIVATFLTGRGRGPLSDFPNVELRLVILQAFIASTAFVGFLICVTIAERRRAEAALEQLATHDPLTGLANRRLFLQRFDGAIARRDRSSEDAAVVYFDLDDFKSINDELGHAAGDAVLVEVGRRLAAAVREGDLVARIGVAPR